MCIKSLEKARLPTPHPFTFPLTGAQQGLATEKAQEQMEPEGQPELAATL